MGQVPSETTCSSSLSETLVKVRNILANHDEELSGEFNEIVESIEKYNNNSLFICEFCKRQYKTQPCYQCHIKKYTIHVPKIY